MHPVLFQLGPTTVYSYGFFIAIGALLGFAYMVKQAKKQFGLTFDQCNTLFIFLLLAGFIGGKFFVLLESPTYLLAPSKLLRGGGFVFYGSLLFAIPTMLWYFRRNKIPTLPMLDVMAAVTCIIHGLGRIGCFLAGCCYGKPSASSFGVVFSEPACLARPLNTVLYPTQLMEAAFIFCILSVLLVLRNRKNFNGQLFLIYLITYATGRFILELYRGDLQRGFVIPEVLSNSQFISLLVIGVAFYFYVRLCRKANLGKNQPSSGK